MSTQDDDLTWMPGWRLRDLMVRGELSPTDVTRHFLERISALDRQLNSFITVAPDLALQEAARWEQQRQSGAEPGLLFGLPLSLKDNYWTRGIRTTAGSLLYRDFVPEQDSVYAERSRAAGAVIIGKTNLPEFALFPRTINLLTPECVNPWDLQRTSGGSSGGAAASMAAGLTPLAIGSDGGGSIRIPAALCGVFGLHPSNGRVPRHGGFGGTLIFSGAGPITRDVRDAAMLLQVLAGADARDPTSMKEPPPDYLASLESGVAGLRALWVPDCGRIEGLDRRVIAAVAGVARRFGDAGVEIDESPTGFEIERWIDAFYTMMHAERYVLFGQQLYENPSVRGLLSEYAREHFGNARSITTAEYVHASRTRYDLLDWLDRWWRGYDLVLSPTVGIVAPLTSGPVVRRPLVAYTFLINYCGYTAATVPCGFVDGLPIGLQIIARPNREDLVLRASRVFEQLQREVGVGRINPACNQNLPVG